jgi:hypothetical protein
MEISPKFSFCYFSHARKYFCHIKRNWVITVVFTVYRINLSTLYLIKSPSLWRNHSKAPTDNTVNNMPVKKHNKRLLFICVSNFEKNNC